MSAIPTEPYGDRIPESVRTALRTVAVERSGLAALEGALGDRSPDGLGPAFAAAVDLFAALRGRAVVTGIGKSGHIARKIAATLASTGMPAFFVHPAEASHGDLGMIRADDAVLAMSWSGETSELADIVTYAKRFRIPLLAATSRPDSALGREADICLRLPVVEEACPNGLAPTTSTTMQLVLGDALAVALLESRGFSAHDFRLFHPGGRLGARLTFVRDLMKSGDAIPIVASSAAMAEAIVEMTGKRFGCVVVVDAAGLVAGIITDGDLRRHMDRDLMRRPVAEVMSRGPTTVAPDDLAAEALATLNEKRRTVLIVVDGARRPVGIIHLHDLLAGGVA